MCAYIGTKSQIIKNSCPDLIPNPLTAYIVELVKIYIIRINDTQLNHDGDQ